MKDRELRPVERGLAVGIGMAFMAVAIFRIFLIDPSGWTLTVDSAVTCVIISLGFWLIYGALVRGRLW